MQSYPLNISLNILIWPRAEIHRESRHLLSSLTIQNYNVFAFLAAQLDLEITICMEKFSYCDNTSLFFLPDFEENYLYSLRLTGVEPSGRSKTIKLKTSPVSDFILSILLY